MPYVDDKGTTRRFSPELAMKVQQKNQLLVELLNECLDKLDPFDDAVLIHKIESELGSNHD